MVYSNKVPVEEQWQRTYGNTAEARRVSLVDSSGSEFNGANPLPVESTAHIGDDMEGKGPVTVGTTAVELTFTGKTESIIISSAINNTGIIYVGKSDVASDGSNAISFLDAGESLTIDYEDSSNAIYVVSDTASQTVFAGAIK